MTGLEVLRMSVGWPRPAEVASSPAGVAAGDVWSLVTSGLLVAGEPGAQLAGMVVTALLVIRLFGPSVLCVAAAVAHLGSALIAYAGIGVLWLLALADVDAVIDAPDYGISCVWAGAVGALAGGALAARRRLLGLGVLVAGAAILAAVVPSGGLARAEHGWAFLLGGLVALRLIRQSVTRSRVT